MNASLIKRIEDLLGGSYAMLESSRSSRYSVGSLDYNITALKTLLRGGRSLDFGIVPIDPLNANDTSGRVGTSIPEPTGSPFYLSVGTTAAIFNGKKVFIQGATRIEVGDEDINGYSPVDGSEYFYAVVTARDTTRFGQAAGTYNVYRGALSKSTANIPSIPYYEAPMALVKVNYYGIYASDIYNDYFYKAHYESCGDDEAIKTIYVSTDDLEEQLKTQNFSLTFQNIVRSLNNYANLKFSTSFKDYCKSIGYTFDNYYFRKLYSDSTQTDLSTPLTEASAGTSKNYPYMLFKEARLEANIKTNGSASGISNIEFYGITPLTTRLSGVAIAADATICLEDASSWPNSGYLCLGGGSYWSVHTYSKLSATMLNVYPQVPTTFFTWNNVYLAEKQSIQVPSGSVPVDYSVLVGTAGSVYLGAANATFITRGLGVNSVLVRNV
jgi:hypothetical protein